MKEKHIEVEGVVRAGNMPKRWVRITAGDRARMEKCPPAISTKPASPGA